MSNVDFEIREHLGVLKENSNGWTKELNLVSWNGSAAKYDIREWNPEHTRMGRGVTFTQDELETLCGFVTDYFYDGEEE